MPRLGVLLMAYGTPEGLDEVEAYYTQIRGGKRPPQALIDNLYERYRAVGGSTPLLRLTRSVARLLEQQLNAAVGATPYRVYCGMKHWHPFIGDTMRQMAADGVQEMIALPLAPHYSQISIGGYRTKVEQANERIDPPLRVRMVESWQAQPGFRRLIAGRIQAALAQFPAEARDQVTVLFSAHSLPERILTWDDPYPRELQESAAAIAAQVGVSRWGFAFQSAGATGEPWLGPDILDTLAQLAGEGRRYVLSVPFGFVADHLEILYDLDIETKAEADKLDITWRRTAMPNDDPAFIDLLATIVQEQTARTTAS